MHTPLIFNMQGFSLDDGPGIRSMIFFKGCPLDCQWCHNPEGKSFGAEEVFHESSCKCCGRCKAGLECIYGAKETVGVAYPIDEVIKKVLRDRQLFEVSKGGVTLSGGEVLAQDGEYLLALLKQFKRQGVHVAIDTSGYAPWEKIDALMPYVDLWLYDLKTASPDIHIQYTGVDNALILSNLQKLSDAGARIWLRVPMIPGVNMEQQEINRMIDIARNIARIEQVNLLMYHRMGQDKVGTPTYFEELTPEQIENALRDWKAAGFNAKIGAGAYE